MLVLSLLLACTGPTKVADTGIRQDLPSTEEGDSGDTASEDTGEPEELPPDTGILVWYTGDATVSSGELVDGHFGLLATDRALQTICRDVGTWEATGPAPGPCPECAWGFTLTVRDTTPEQDACRQLGFRRELLDGFEAGWAFAPTWAYEYGDTVFELDTVLLYWDTSAQEWVPYAFNMDGVGYNQGDASQMSFQKYVSRFSYFSSF